MNQGLPKTDGKWLAVLRGKRWVTGWTEVFPVGSRYCTVPGVSRWIAAEEPILTGGAK